MAILPIGEPLPKADWLRSRDHRKHDEWTPRATRALLIGKSWRSTVVTLRSMQCAREHRLAASSCLSTSGCR